jgi:hypothetical protein
LEFQPIRSRGIRAQFDGAISSDGGIIARRFRSYEREDAVFDPPHDVALLEKKTGALDRATPLVGWELPPCFSQLRRLLEARLNKGGKGEYVQVLRLLETLRLEQVAQALHFGRISFDVLKHLLLCRIEQRPPRRGGFMV